jgi:hypothetical protein
MRSFVIGSPQGVHGGYDVEILRIVMGRRQWFFFKTVAWSWGLTKITMNNATKDYKKITIQTLRDNNVLFTSVYIGDQVIYVHIRVSPS